MIPTFVDTNILGEAATANKSELRCFLAVGCAVGLLLCLILL